MDIFLEKIKNYIVNAYIRNSGYRLSNQVCKSILKRTSFFPFEKREDRMLGYTEYTLKEGLIYTEIHYENHNSLLKTAMILTHEIGHAIIVEEPLIENNKIVYCKRALLDVAEGKKNGDYLTEGFLEAMSDSIWRDTIFQLDLKELYLDGYLYKDERIFKLQSYYEEYKTLYMLSNALFQNSLFLNAFSKEKVSSIKGIPVSYEEWIEKYNEVCEALETLFRKEAHFTTGYYFEEYFYKKDQFCDQMKRFYKVKEEMYSKEEKEEIERLFNLYIQNIEALSVLPFTESQRRKYMIPVVPDGDEIQKQIEKMPKVELHLHLDGSVRRETMEEILGRTLKEEEVSVMQKGDLNEYLAKFSLPIECMQTKENLKRISRELALDLKRDNVIYAEIRFAPFKHTKYISSEEVIESVLEGLHSVVGIQTRVILCMMRGEEKAQNKKVIDLAQQYQHKGVCAVDLAGAEALYPTHHYKSLFEYAKEKRVLFTIHAGEADGRESIEDALSFGTKRLGHGIRILETSSLIYKAKKEGILFEVCPTSNLQTIPTLAYAVHPVYEMYKKGLRVCISTDNRTVSHVTLNEEYLYLSKYFPFKIEDFIKMNEYAIEGAFVGKIEKERLKEILHE